MLPMVFHTLAINENIIQVDFDMSLDDEIIEDVVHHFLEGGWGVGHSKVHYHRFE